MQNDLEDVDGGVVGCLERKAARKKWRGMSHGMAHSSGVVAATYEHEAEAKAPAPMVRTKFPPKASQRHRPGRKSRGRSLGPRQQRPAGPHIPPAAGRMSAVNQLPAAMSAAEFLDRRLPSTRRVRPALGQRPIARPGWVFPRPPPAYAAARQRDMHGRGGLCAQNGAAFQG